MGSIPVSGRSPEKGKGNHLDEPENPVDRGGLTWLQSIGLDTSEVTINMHAYAFMCDTSEEHVRHM